MYLFHHVDVIQAVPAVPAPAHVLERAGHILLPVQIIGLVAKKRQLFVGISHHPGHFLGRREIYPLFKQVRALLQRQGMHRDVGGVQGRHRVQGVAEALVSVAGKACDQVHVDIFKACIDRLIVSTQNIGAAMGSAGGFQDAIHHGLGIDAHPVCAVSPQSCKLFFVQGVGPTALHCPFYQPT